MSEQKNYRDHPYAYDFDAEWDVERAIHGLDNPPPRRSASQAPAYGRSGSSGRPRSKTGSASSRAASTRTAPPRRRRPTGSRRKARRANVRGLVILGGMALGILLVIVLLISLIIRAVSPKEPDIPVETRANYTTDDTPSVPENLSAEEQLVQKADRLAAGYDYSAAVDLLKTYGTDWESNATLAAARDRYEATKDALVSWSDPTQVPHLAFHPLIADAELAFNSPEGMEFSQNMVTVDEFRAILSDLYNRGYVLVSLHQFARYGVDEDGNQTYLPGNISLPEGKKPLILSQDDVNYYEYMVDSDGDRKADGGKGFANRLVVDDQGYPTCEYRTSSGETVTGAYDLIPILEDFIQEHPDFSYKGARAVISVTGMEGVFGYRTHPEWKMILSDEEYKEEVRAAQDVARSLREHGWEIASHSFGHESYSDLSDDDIASDVRKWENQVQPIVGDSDIFVFPYGGDLEDGEDTYGGDDFDALYDAGYRFFLSITPGQNYAQLTSKYVRQGRRYVDGYTMLTAPEQLQDLFDASAVLDASRQAN